MVNTELFFKTRRIIMKKVFFTIVIILLFSNALFAKTTIRITNGEWEPFMSEYSYQYGINSHIIY